jgi:hypothetical protein
MLARLFRVFVSVFAIGIIPQLVFSQDLIISLHNDSLNCRITKVKPNYIYFYYNLDGETVNTLIPSSKVKLYAKNYYSTAEARPLTISSRIKEFPKIRYAMQGGLSRRNVIIAGSQQELLYGYEKRIKNGYNIGAEFNYFFTDLFGLGLKYTYFSAKNQINYRVSIITSEPALKGSFLENVKTNFISPVASWRILSNDKKNALFASLGIGYMRYVNEQKNGDPVNIVASIPATFSEIGYDLGLNEKISIGIMVSYYSAVVFGNERTTQLSDDLPFIVTDDKILSRIDFSIGLRFKK